MKKLVVGFIIGCVVSDVIYAFITLARVKPQPEYKEIVPPLYGITMDKSCYDQLINSDGKVHIYIHKFPEATESAIDR